LKILLINKELLSPNFSVEIMASLLPLSLHEKGFKYKSIDAQENYFLGRLLLKKALLDCNFDLSNLEKICFSLNGKPTIERLHFSITHSGNYVAIAYSTDVEVGLDIQSFMPIDFSLFKKWFTEEEWSDISNNEDQSLHFFNHWVAKESVLKLLDLPLSYVPNISIQDLKKGKLHDEKEVYHIKFISAHLVGAVGSLVTKEVILDPILKIVTEEDFYIT
jgi:phosphopantetheine--protein transferase-like protein